MLPIRAVPTFNHYFGKFSVIIVLYTPSKVANSAPFAEFSRAQSEFESSQKAALAAQFAAPVRLPWQQLNDGRVDQSIKDQILRLSLDEQNFLHSVQPSTSARSPERFDDDSLMPLASALLREDSNLAAMRFHLVPK